MSKVNATTKELTEALQTLQGNMTLCGEDCGHDFEKPHGVLKANGVAEFLAEKLGISESRGSKLCARLGDLGLRVTAYAKGGKGQRAQLIARQPTSIKAGMLAPLVGKAAVDLSTPVGSTDVPEPNPSAESHDPIAAHFAEFAWRGRRIAELEQRVADLQEDARIGRQFREAVEMQ